MEFRNLDLTIVSAEDLKKVSHFSKLHPLAIAWVDPYNRQSTRVDKNGGLNPTWNQRLSLPIAEPFFQQPASRLHIEIYSKGLMGNKFVGAAAIPLSDLLQHSNSKELMTYQLRRRSGKMKGAVRISAQIGEKVAVTGPSAYGGAGDPVTAYPYNQKPQQGYYPQGGYQQGYYPPQQYQGYPPQGYPQQGYQPQQPYNGRYGRPGRMGGGMGGLGTGLLAGGLGGLLIGDMIGDHDGYGGGGYDGGGYDGGGYDGGGGFDGGGFDGGGFDGGF